MCGIVGIAGSGFDRVLDAMNQVQFHRGPDDGGTYLDPSRDVGLAMRRLSILDLAGGRQPMCNEDESLWIVFNGEIYNAPELRAALETRHRFKTDHSDTEVLIHLIEEQGTDSLSRLNGMFAFVVYDRIRNCLWGARDPFGIKPLFYYCHENNFAFASELKSLLHYPAVRREIHPTGLHHYLGFRYVPGEETIYRGVRRVPPGGFFHYDLSSRELTVKSYWRLRFQPVESVSEDEWAERIRHGLRRAAVRWTLSDVPIGCSLSGGLDSTAIVALLAESGFTNLKTYTVGYDHPDERRWNEAHLAKQVAERYRTDHHELIVRPDSLLDDLIDMVWHLDEPYGGGLPSWFVFRFMRREVTVGLTGSGGDELFGNYAKWWLPESRGVMKSRLAYYRELKHAGRLRPGWRQTARAMGAAMAVQVDSIRDSLFQYYHPMYYRESEKRRYCLLSRRHPELNSIEFLREIDRRTGANSLRDRVMAVDFRTQLPEEFLFMTDRFSMAHSLEARVPFLDKELVDLVSTIPASIRTKAGDPKYLLRKAIGHLLPDDVRGGRKRGFVLPTGVWLRGALRPLVERLLSKEFLQKQQIFDPRFFDALVRPHLEGEAELGDRIWPVLMFQLWYIVFIQENCISKPSITWKDLC